MENSGGIQDLKHTSSYVGKRVPVYPFIRSEGPSRIAWPCHLVGRTRLSPSSPCHPPKSPHIPPQIWQACVRINHSGSLHSN